MSTAGDIRYVRWREAVRSKIWALDRHWYGLLGRLYLLRLLEGPRRDLRLRRWAAGWEVGVQVVRDDCAHTARKVEANFGEYPPDGG